MRYNSLVRSPAGDSSGPDLVPQVSLYMGVKKIMLLNYYFFNLRHSALLVLTVNDNEMTLDQIRSAKLQHVSTARLHIAFCLGTPQAWAESASHRVALVL